MLPPGWYSAYLCGQVSVHVTTWLRILVWSSVCTCYHLAGIQHTCLVKFLYMLPPGWYSPYLCGQVSVHVTTWLVFPILVWSSGCKMLPPGWYSPSWQSDVWHSRQTLAGQSIITKEIWLCSLLGDDCSWCAGGHGTNYSKNLVIIHNSGVLVPLINI